MAPATLDWLGCATFRLTLADLVVFLDAYIDRVPSAPPVGLTTGDVDRADWIVVGHSHFDHVWGAETIARNTGATRNSRSIPNSLSTMTLMPLNMDVNGTINATWATATYVK